MSESSDSDNEGVYNPAAVTTTNTTTSTTSTQHHQHQQHKQQQQEQQQQEQYHNNIINPILLPSHHSNPSLNDNNNNRTNVDVDIRLSSRTEDDSVSVTTAAVTGFADMLRHDLTQKMRLTDSDLIYHACRVNLLGTNHPFQSSGISSMLPFIFPPIHLYIPSMSHVVYSSTHISTSLAICILSSMHSYHLDLIIITIIMISFCSVGGSWILPTTRPACLKPMLHKQQYREFAELINKAMSWQYLSYDMLSFYLITLIVPPLSAYYMVRPHQRLCSYIESWLRTI